MRLGFRTTTMRLFIAVIDKRNKCCKAVYCGYYLKPKTCVYITHDPSIQSLNGLSIYLFLQVYNCVFFLCSVSRFQIKCFSSNVLLFTLRSCCCLVSRPSKPETFPQPSLTFVKVSQDSFFPLDVASLSLFSEV